MSGPGNKPLLVFDGRCGFCKAWVSRLRSLAAGKIEIKPSSAVLNDFPNISQEEFDRAVRYFDEKGEAYTAAEAVYRALAAAPGGNRWLLYLYERAPLFKALSERGYGYVARHRRLFGWLTRFFWGQRTELPTYFLGRWLFLRGIALCYFAAFVSLGVQIEGLIGSEGILPAAKYLADLSRRLGGGAFWALPTVFWWGASDAALGAVCWTGAAVSFLALAGNRPGDLFRLLWTLYLSLVGVAGLFLGYQWDILLLEAGFIAIWTSPPAIWPRLKTEKRPGSGVLWAGRWLLFKLMFLSGVVKLASQDPAWRSWTALNYHYESQPLPTALAWYAHQLPDWFQKVSVGLMFGIELVLPFFIFFPRRARLAAFAGFNSLMLLIFLTGNYTFFNFLAMALSCLLLDDASVARVLPARASDSVKQAYRRACEPRVWRATGVLLLAFTLATGGAMVLRRAIRKTATWRPLAWLEAIGRSSRLVHSYGLFAVMTTARNEIVLEGSEDGRVWKEYEFKWKPGDISRAPGWVQPHQPRLDWQMWFAVLGNYRNNPWFIRFMIAILEGRAPVLALMDKVPFPQSPPRYLRALLYRYHFTDQAGAGKGGAWWRREGPLGLYAPVATRTPQGVRFIRPPQNTE